MFEFEVGKDTGLRGMDNMIFDMTDSGGILVIRMNRPTAAEKREFNCGLSFKLAVVDDIIFILARMGTLNWMDAPYYRELSRNLTHIIVPEKSQGIAVHAMLIDGSNGILHAQKLIGLPHDMSIALIDAIKNQPIISNYANRLNHTMALYTTDQFVERAIKC